MQIHAADAGHQDRVQGRGREQGAQVEGGDAVQYADADPQRAEAEAGQQTRQDRRACAGETDDDGA
ncbi:hypothetical protein HRW08_36150, partial [Streptomyces lunaelactis]|nr:hypothetical protein [Streptomyces lunaelactis]